MKTLYNDDANREECFTKLDELIIRVKKSKTPAFERHRQSRSELISLSSDNDLLKELAIIVAYSQNAPSDKVYQVINSSEFNVAFDSFDVNKVSQLNPIDVWKEQWESLSGIRQSTKIFQIIISANVILNNPNIYKTFNDKNIPKSLSDKKDLDLLWKMFKAHKNKFEDIKMPFLRSNTSLLHLLLHIGYPFIKPDSVVLAICKNHLNLFKGNASEATKLKCVYSLQEYCISRNIPPSLLDLYLLVAGGQKEMLPLVNTSFDYKFFKRDSKP